MRLYFAGLARNCSTTLRGNLASLLALACSGNVSDFRIFIIENDSDDQTRAILIEFASLSSRIHLRLLNGLEKRLPLRQQRLAYCRELLWSEIRRISCKEDSLYIPVDLDSHIIQSISSEEFFSACRNVVSKQAVAVFPVSKPFYYDIYALRSKGWCDYDCQEKIQESLMKHNRISWFLATRRYVVANQYSYKRLTAAGKMLPVESAFAGIGIYLLDEIRSASYLQANPPPKTPPPCEHVVFNSNLSNLYIDTNFTVLAPKEHIKYHSIIWHILQVCHSAIVMHVNRCKGVGRGR